MPTREEPRYHPYPKDWLARPQRSCPARHAGGVAVAAAPAARPAPAAAGAPVLRVESASFQGGTYSVKGRLESAAPPELVYEVLTDYEALPRVFHNVESSSVRIGAGGETRIVQSVSWSFLIFRGSFVTELRVEERPACRQVAFSLLRSPFMREFLGAWSVRPGVAGSGGGSDIGHTLAILPVISPPQSIGDITKPIFEAQVRSILEDLGAELDRRLRLQREQQGAARAGVAGQHEGRPAGTT